MSERLFNSFSGGREKLGGGRDPARPRATKHTHAARHMHQARAHHMFYGIFPFRATGLEPQKTYAESFRAGGKKASSCVKGGPSGCEAAGKIPFVGGNGKLSEN